MACRRSFRLGGPVTLNLPGMILIEWPLKPGGFILMRAAWLEAGRALKRRAQFTAPVYFVKLGTHG